MVFYRLLPLGIEGQQQNSDEWATVALVTGANRGLGFETCIQLAQLGITVILSADLIKDLIKGQAVAKRVVDKRLDLFFTSFMY